MPGGAAGSDSSGITHRVPRSLSGALQPSATMYFGATCAHMAPRGRAAVNVRDDEPDPKLHGDRMTITTAASINPGFCRLRRQTELPHDGLQSDQKVTGKDLPVTSLMRQPVTKLREAV